MGAGARAALVVIAGGEPLLQRTSLLPLVAALRDAGRRVEIETNGTIDPGADMAALAWFHVSPKLGGAGVSDLGRIRPNVLTALRDTGKCIFKFVISGPDDIAELVEIQERFELSRVWVMPQGTDSNTVIAGLRSLAGPALKHGWNLSLRLHVLLWEDQRGH